MWQIGTREQQTAGTSIEIFEEVEKYAQEHGLTFHWPVYIEPRYHQFEWVHKERNNMFEPPYPQVPQVWLQVYELVTSGRVYGFLFSQDENSLENFLELKKNRIVLREDR